MTGTGRVGGKERGCPVFDEEEEESTTTSSVLLPRDVLVVRSWIFFILFCHTSHLSHVMWSCAKKKFDCAYLIYPRTIDTFTTTNISHSISLSFFLSFFLHRTEFNMPSHWISKTETNLREDCTADESSFQFTLRNRRRSRARKRAGRRTVECYWTLSSGCSEENFRDTLEVARGGERKRTVWTNCKRVGSEDV